MGDPRRRRVAEAERRAREAAEEAERAALAVARAAEDLHRACWAPEEAQRPRRRSGPVERWAEIIQTIYTIRHWQRLFYTTGQALQHYDRSILR